ncbi:MAG TPA: PD-(D/E)XK nuclease-like domain-containing protein [Kiritimatiellia bacterium]|nr:PD-(D/E)XK nuclease-like domain-containing protein [Kiritimatiellia bacterium]
MNEIFCLNLLTSEPAEEYHAKRGRFMSSHQLLDFMKCPWLHRKKSVGLIKDADSNSYLVGRAAHVRILEGREVYERSFALGGPINEKTGKPFGAGTKAFAEWAEAQGKPVLAQEQVDLVEQMAAGVGMNDEAVALLLFGRAEGVVRAEYCGTPCQIRIDWLHPHRGIVDLKTCDDLTWFEADARRYGYHRQMAFYRAVLERASGGYCDHKEVAMERVKGNGAERVPVHLIAVEKKEPYRCGVWRVSDETLAQAQRENEAAIRRLLACRESGDWPTGFEEIRVLDVV